MHQTVDHTAPARRAPAGAGYLVRPLARLAAASVVLAALAAPRPLLSQGEQDVMVMRVERLRPNVHVISGFTNGNILVLDGSDGVVLVDAQSAKRAALADSALRTITTRPVRLVIDTHYHEDHVGGNALWRGRGASVVAHRNVAVQAAKDTTVTDWQLFHRVPPPPEGMPTVLFSDSLVLRLDGEELRVVHAPTAHTDGDAMVWLRDANVVHMGDILELGAPPFIDWWAGGTLEGMLPAADGVLRAANADTRIVPGHGPVTDQAGLRAYRDMIATIGDRVRGAVRAGRTLDEVLASRPTAEFDARLGGERRSRRFVELLYIGFRRELGRPAAASRGRR